jgi:hypothetical protein
MNNCFCDKGRFPNDEEIFSDNRKRFPGDEEIFLKDKEMFLNGGEMFPCNRERIKYRMSLKYPVPSLFCRVWSQKNLSHLFPIYFCRLKSNNSKET